MLSAPWQHLPQSLRHPLAALWAELRLDPACSGLRTLSILGPKPELASPLPVAEAMALAMLAASCAATSFGALRGVQTQTAHVTLRTALAHVHAERMFGPTLNHRPLASRMVRDNPLLATPYRCKDGLYLMPSALYPQQLLQWLRFLRVPPTHDAVAQAFASRSGADWEKRAAQANLAAAVCRSRAQWREHPQGLALSGTPVVTLNALGEGERRAPSAGDRPLAGLRVLALTHGVAGPLVGRTLAEHGADVLHVGHPEVFEHEAVWCEAYVGCRSMGLDLDNDQHRAHLKALLRQCDVVVLSLSPRAQHKLGLDAPTLARQHAHVVQVRLSAYGSCGPWQQRPGFDMNAMAATGMMVDEARHSGTPVPQLPPTLLLNDFLMGYLAAAGACAALWHRAETGVVSEVAVNLARVAMWCQDLDMDGATATLETSDEPIATLRQQTPLGELYRMAPGVRLSITPGAWPTPLLVPRVSLAGQSRWPD